MGLAGCYKARFDGDASGGCRFGGFLSKISGLLFAALAAAVSAVLSVALLAAVPGTALADEAASAPVFTTAPGTSVTPIAPGDYLIRRTDTDAMVLDAQGGGTADGTNVQLYGANGTAAQSWRITHDNKGYYTFVNLGSGLALDVQMGCGVGWFKRAVEPNQRHACTEVEGRFHQCRLHPSVCAQSPVGARLCRRRVVEWRQPPNLVQQRFQGAALHVH